jgi:hypothetical protein
MTRITNGGAVHRAPKYLRSRIVPTGIDCRWSAKDYGLLDACIVAADVTEAQHAELTGYADVAAAPADLDRPIGAALPQVQTVLEALRVPSAGVTTQHTFRQVLRYVCALFAFAQRYHAMHDEPLVDGEATLDTVWGVLPLARRQRLLATAKALHYHTAGMGANWPLRYILKHLADQQWTQEPIHFGPVRL